MTLMAAMNANAQRLMCFHVGFDSVALLSFETHSLSISRWLLYPIRSCVHFSNKFMNLRHRFTSITIKCSEQNDIISAAYEYIARQLVFDSACNCISMHVTMLHARTMNADVCFGSGRFIIHFDKLQSAMY